MADRSRLIESLRVEIELAEKAGASAAVVAKMEKDASRIQSAINRLDAKGPTKQIEVLTEAVKRMGGVEKLTEDQTSRLASELQRLEKAGARIPAELQPAIAALNRLRDAEKSAADQAARTAEAQAKAAAETATLKAGILDKAGLGALSGLGPATGALLATGAMAGAAKETYELIKASAELADTISDLSQEYQVSTDEIQTWQRIQKDTGVTVQAIGGSVTALSKILTNSPDKFKEWGMDVAALRALAPEQLLGAMGTKLQELSATERLAFVEDFKIANELIPHLISGFDQLRETSRGAITPLSEAELERLQETKKALTGLETAWADMWTEIGNSLGQDAAVKEFFTEIKDGLVELVKYIADHREELAFFAKFVAAAAGMDAIGAAKAVGSYPGAKVDGAIAGAKGRRDQALEEAMNGGPTARAPGWSKFDADAIEAARKAKEKAAAELKAKNEQARKELEAKIDGENAWYLAGMENAKKTAEAAKAAQKWMAEELIKASNNVLKMLTPGAEDAARRMALNAPPGTLNAGAIKALGADVLSTRSDAFDPSKPKRFDLISPPDVKEAEKVKTSWSSFLQVAANQFQLMGKSGALIGKIAGGVGGIGAMFGSGGALEGVSGITSLFKGGKNGDALKSITGGLTAAFAAFDMGKALYSMFHKTEAQKVAFDVGRDYGVQISEGLSKEIAKNSKTMGREGASLLSLDKIIGEAGGVAAFGLDKTIGKMHDLFSMIQTGKLTAEQARKPFDALFGEVAQSSISKTTGLISQQVKELMALDATSGMKSAAVEKFRAEQRSIAGAIVGRLASNKDFKVSGQGAGTAFAGALVAEYNRLVDEGLSGAEIGAKLLPQIDALQKKFEEAGVTGGAAWDGMVQRLGLFTDEVTGPTASAFEDLTSLMAALYNSGDLSKEAFAGLSQQIGQTYTEAVKKATEAGKSEEEVFNALAPKLQKVWELRQRFGVAVDDQTAQLLDRAQTAGMIGPEFMDPVVAEQTRTNEILEAGFKGLGADLSGLSERTAARVALDIPALNIPTDMSAYGGGFAGGARFEAAIAEMMAQQGGDAPTAPDIGKATADAISGQIQGVVAGLASQPIQLNAKIVLDSGPIVGEVAEQINRNKPAGNAVLGAINRRKK